MRAVSDTVGLSSTHIRRLVARGEFPQPVDISVGRHGWIEAEVLAWLRTRIAARDARLREGAR